MEQPAGDHSVVAITGVTRGLGRAMVDQFARLGHTVCGCARTADQIRELAYTYPQHDFRTVDVSSDEEVRRWARRLITKYRAPDFLLNNAAIMHSKVLLWKYPDREFSHQLRVNVDGVVNVIRHFTPAMISRQKGVIVNFTSRWGRTIESGLGPYCASKWAIVALTKILATELIGKGVAAVEFNPGIVQTAMLRTYYGNHTRCSTSGYPTPTEWARVAVPFILTLGLKDSGKLRKPLFIDARSNS